VANLLLDGDMELADANLWDDLLVGSVSKQANAYRGARCLRVSGNAGSSAYSCQYNAAIPAGRLRVSGWARSDGGRAPRLYTPQQATFIWAGTLSTSWQWFDCEYTNDAVGYGPLLWTTGLAAAGYTEWDDISLELPAHPHFFAALLRGRRR
jgi:hypothetical protein